VAVEKVHYLLPRRRCGRCGTTTTAAVPYAQASAVVYGPHLNAAAVLLAYQGNVPIERTALVMEALLGVPVSSGFVARALARLAERLQRASFDEAMTAALRAEDVLCGDETPTNVIGRDHDETTGQPVTGAPHAITLRTPDARLIWYAAMGSRSKTAISNLGVLEGYTGYLVRDDYAGWHQFDPHLAGVQQCAAHLIRHCKGMLDESVPEQADRADAQRRNDNLLALHTHPAAPSTVCRGRHIGVTTERPDCGGAAKPRRRVGVDTISPLNHGLAVAVPCEGWLASTR
jgi:hypothetical protein